MKDLTISHAVRHTASNVASFKLHSPDFPVPYRHEVSLNPDQIERDVWMVAQSFADDFAVKSTLRFYLEAELVAEIPNSRARNHNLRPEDGLLVGVHTGFTAAGYISEMPASARQPTLTISQAADHSRVVIVPSFFLKVRATRAVLDIERGTATVPAVTGLAILSQYP